MSTGGMTMKRRLVAIGQIAAIMIVLVLRLSIPSEAGVFWMEDFESHLTPNWSSYKACADTQPPLGPPDGCNAQISTTVAHSGTHSFWSHFDTGCGMSGDGDCGGFYDRTHTPASDYWIRFYFY